MRCDNCGAKATRKVIEGFNGRVPYLGDDPDFDVGYYCDDCAGEDGRPVDDEPEEGDEGPEYRGPSLREQQIRAYEMDKNPNDPRW